MFSITKSRKCELRPVKTNSINFRPAPDDLVNFVSIGCMTF